MSEKLKIGRTPIDQCVAYFVCGTFVDKFLINKETWQGAALYGASATAGAIFSDTFVLKLDPNHKKKSIAVQLVTESIIDNVVFLPIEMLIGLDNNTSTVKKIAGNTLTNLLGTIATFAMVRQADISSI